MLSYAGSQVKDGIAEAMPDEWDTEADLFRDGYDPIAIDAYFRKNPAAIARRAALVASTAARVVACLGRRDYGALVDVVGPLGPTYVKFGQALASRSDIVGPDIAAALGALQDDMGAFPDAEARAVVAGELPQVLEAFDAAGAPVAAASLCQVYKSVLPDGRQVALKVQRPGIAAQVAADAWLLRAAAGTLEATGAVKAKAVAAVDEFCSRIFEEMDFRREAANLRRFGALYGPGGSHTLPGPGVTVPGLIPGLESRRVLVMEWLDGEKLTAGVKREVSAGDLPLVRLGIECTLSQLLETGVMHADPHGGNLLRRPDGSLAYLDFGLVSDVPAQVRDGLVSAVSLLVFSRDYPRVARLFGELMLIPPEVVSDEREMKALEEALERAARATLVYAEGDVVPNVRFDQLIGALLGLVPRFKFVLPPYFVNNARALGTLEGMARSADPKFNILAVVYPYAVRRTLANPSQSPVVRSVVRALVSDDGPGGPQLSLKRLLRLAADVTALTGRSRLEVARDALHTKEGRTLCVEVLGAECRRGISRAVGGCGGWWRRLFRRQRGDPLVSADGPTGSLAGSGSV